MNVFRRKVEHEKKRQSEEEEISNMTDPWQFLGMTAYPWWRPPVVPDLMTKIGLSFVAFGCLHIMSDVVWRRYVDLSKYNKSDQYAFPEKVCSTVHALWSGGLGLWSVMWKGHFADNPAYAYPPEVDNIFAVSVAYQLYDMAIMLLQKTDPWSMWVHHTLSALGSFLIMIYRAGAFPPTAFIVTELTVPFANLDWYLKKLNFAPEHPAVKACSWSMLFAYLLFRTFTGPLVIWWMTKLNQLSKFLKLPVILSGLSTINVLVLSLLNLKWTYQLIRRSLFAARKVKPKLT